MQSEVETIAQHYLLAALWADSPEGTNPRITQQAQKAALRIADAFWQDLPQKMRDNLKLLHNAGYGMHPDCGTVHPVCAAIGHDLYLTSQGHGVGFWNRKELPETIRDILTNAAKKHSKAYPDFYRGWLYIHGVK